MKYLYNKRRYRRGDGDGHSFAFFAVGSVAILAVVFVIGLQVGRVIEKNAASADPLAAKAASSADHLVSKADDRAPGETKSSAQPPSTRPVAVEIGKELGAYSVEAGKVPVVPPPDAKESAGNAEKRLTFHETLPRKEAGPASLVPPERKENQAASGVKEEPRRKYVVQAASFREKGTAESFRKRLAKAGYTVRMVKGTGKDREKYYRLLVGPFADRETAKKTVERLKEEMKVEAYLLPG